MNKKIWLIGTGNMALEYGKVLQGMGLEFHVVGRGEASARTFEEKTGLKAITGGLDTFLGTRPSVPDAVIVSVGVEQLASMTSLLLDYGVRRVLVEKPGGLYREEISGLAQKAIQNSAEVLIAYNRRFYSSVQKALEIIADDGGVTSFNFEFTEWGHVIQGLEKGEGVKERWFLANSTHVVDMAFFMGGAPRELQCYTAGSLDWHPESAVFAGAGVSEEGALFSYQADWAAPGRWGVEVLTRKHRLIFRPLEKLQIQKIGSVAVEQVEIDDSLDLSYKPGLYRQVKSFLAGDSGQFCSIQKQADLFDVYERMPGYL